MGNRGLSLGAAVAAGVLLAHTVLPIRPTAGAAAVALSCLATIGSARAWLLVPATLGAWRAATVQAAAEGRELSGPMRAEGWVSVMGEAGRGRRVQVGRRQALVADTTRVLPPPGYDARLTLRLDPLRSRADPSAFRADRWARARRIDARGRELGGVRQVRPTAGWTGQRRRIITWIRDRARTRLGYGESTARSLVTALVIGDRTALEAPALEAFRRAGLAHVLALSGMHVGVLALGFGSLLRALRLPPAAILLFTLGFLGAFAAIAGGAAPILRACGTGGLALLAGALHRRSPPGHGLGLVAGALLLSHPPLLFDPGFRLSFLAAGTLAAFAAHAPRPKPGWRGWPQTLGEGLLMSACVTLATAPEIVSSFGAVSVLSPVTNLLAGLPATLALGWGALGAWLPGAWSLSGSASLAAELLLRIAAAADHIPGGNLQLPAPGVAWSTWIVAATLAGVRRRWPSRRTAWMLGGGLVLAALASRPADRVTFLDIGQGDAVLLERRGRAVLVDTGPPDWGGREPPAVAAVRSRRRRLDALVLTHGHSDHTGGAEEILRAEGTRSLLVRARSPNETLSELSEAAERRGIVVSAVTAASPVSPVPGIQVGTPWERGLPDDVSENDRSLVTRWTCGSRSVLLLGDGGHRSEAAWLASRPDAASARATVLLAPHHGSRESTGEALLASVRPALVILSCGRGNPHGHPHAETLARLRTAGVATLRTDRDGSITLTAAPGGGFRLRWERGFPGPAAWFPAFRLSRSGPFP